MRRRSPGSRFYRGPSFCGCGGPRPARSERGRPRLDGSPRPVLGARLRRNQASPRVHVVDHPHLPSVRRGGRPLRRVPPRDGTGSQAAREEGPPDARRPRLFRICGLSSLLEPRGGGPERHRGDGGPHHRLGARIHRDSCGAAFEGASRSASIRRDRGRIRRARGDDLVHASRERVPVSRLGRRDRRPPSRGVLGAVRRPREVLPPAVPSVHLRRLDPPARHGASCPPPDLDRSRFLVGLRTMGLSGWMPVLYLGILPTFIGYGIWFRALARLRTASAGAYIYVSTLVAVVGGIAILGEPVTLAMIGGGGMVIAGVVLAQQLKKP